MKEQERMRGEAGALGEGCAETDKGGVKEGKEPKLWNHTPQCLCAPSSQHLQLCIKETERFQSQLAPPLAAPGQCSATSVHDSADSNPDSAAYCVTLGKFPSLSMNLGIRTSSGVYQTMS